MRRGTGARNWCYRLAMDAYNFTARSRRALMAAGDESAALKHEYVGTEHILLALLHDTECLAYARLNNLGVNLDAMEALIGATLKPGQSELPAGSPRPYTSRTKKVLELAMAAARDDNHSDVRTDHLLHGMLREKIGIGAQVLAAAGVTLEQLSGDIPDARPIDD